jgi:TonB-dependent SusC/RagA subfamily outer membrane receptor
MCSNTFICRTVPLSQKPMRILFLILFITLYNLTSCYAQTDYYSRRWSDVYRYEMKALPKSALAVVDTLYRKAKAERNIPQLTKALLYQSKFTIGIEENAELTVVNHFKEEIAQSKTPLKNILESMLAKIYWDYFQQNRYKYYERSRTEAIINKNDFRTWSTQDMFEQVHRHFQNSLKDAEPLQKISVATLNDLLIQSWNSKLYRPTIYDLLAHQALDFYESSESSIDKPIRKFEIDDVRYFADFENIKLSGTDSLAPTLQALHIFQSLLSFHKNANDTAAYIDVELERLQLLTEEGKFDDPFRLKVNRLHKLKSVYARHSASALIDFEIASLLEREGNQYNVKTKKNQFKKRDALQLCDEVIRAFPKSDGAEKCKALRSNILSTTLTMRTEKYISVGLPSLISIDYKNIDKLYFSVYRITEEFEENFKDTYIDSARQAQLKTLTFHSQWNVELPSQNDYQRHSTEVKMPAFPSGRYLIYAYEPNSAEAEDVGNGYATFQVTNLTIVETRLAEGYRFQVVDRNTGSPIAKADVNMKSTETTGATSNFNEKFVTDKNGFFELKASENNYNRSARIRAGNDEATFGDFYLYNYAPPRRDERYNAKVFLFTDRSIYRPGQTVYFKGILLKTKDEKSSLVTGEYVEVFLDDVNGDEVGMLRLKTNSFGSFSGEFKLPASGLTGEYSLYADEDSEGESKFYDNLYNFDNSGIDISVEEYKRPTFEVSFKPLTGSFKLNDTVKVTGGAAAYNGAKISKSKVKYSVTRTISYPYRYDFYFDDDYSDIDGEEIAFGEIITDKNGEFVIPFPAVPDEDSLKDDSPVFNYVIEADVTDISGETRSAHTTVKVGYHSLVVSTMIDPVIIKSDPLHSITITSENLNGQFLQASGTIRIYKLQGPIEPLRERVWEAPDMTLLSENEFRGAFPHEPYSNEKWSKVKMMFETSFNTNKSKEVKFITDASWINGKYLIELSSADPDGTAVTHEKNFQLVDLKSKTVADNQLLVFETDKSSYKAGDIIRLKVGSASKDATIVIDVENDQKIIKTYVEHFSGNVKEFSVPLPELPTENFFIHCSLVNYNSSTIRKKPIAVVPKEEKPMTIETVTFKDKLQPGAKQTWSFEITGDESMSKQAEVLASMYDASLDQFKKHEWTFPSLRESSSGSIVWSSTNNSFSNEYFILNNFHRGSTTYKQFYDALDWFGFSITNNDYIHRQYLNRLYSSGENPYQPSKVTMLNSKGKADGFIYGRLTASDDSPIAGVNVVVKGTTRGTVTDIDGNYTIEADKGDVLVFSFIGYSTAEAAIGKKNTVNVLLQEDVKQLSEVVVTAAGVQVLKRSLSSAVSTVVADTVSREYSIQAMLEGKAAGVQINVPGAGASQIVIRGLSSIDNSKVLYVIDGVFVESYRIDQSDVASIEIIKGSAAVAIYGSRAVNGVVVITTKAGQKKVDEELAKVNARKNFNETAFFFPHLTTNETGAIRFTFTTPESLTRWKLQLLAYNKNLQNAVKTLNAVTQKELMVTPNAPRFLRVGDEIILSVKISNLTTKNMDGKALLQLTDAVSGAVVDDKLNNLVRNQSFRIAPKGNTELSWKLNIPSNLDAIQYKVIAKAGNYSDGEQNVLPVLPNRMLVTETLPMYVRGGQKKTFVLDKLKGNSSATLQQHQLSLEVTSNPAWYAVQSLPYLMEFPHECAEQLFSRYYANALGSHIANSNPKVKAVFETWTSSNALVSNLEKNKELKSILIEETPWIRDAQSDSERKKRIGMLFDLQAMSNQLGDVASKLEGMQMSDGGFPWFSGGRYASRYITQHVASGFGHLIKLKVSVNDEKAKTIIKKAIGFLDNQIIGDYDYLVRQRDLTASSAKSPSERERLNKEYMGQKNISNEQIHYLYMRSFFPDHPMSEKLKSVVNYYQGQCASYWKDYNLYMQGMIALIHFRNGNHSLASDIIKSLKEYSTSSDELGMYWKENKAGWYWQESPVETQALLIEAFAEIESTDHNQSEEQKRKTIDELRVWLLKNKQTTQWKTTKATTEAIYALLLNGTDWLSLEKQVDVNIGGNPLVTGNDVEAGTGYFNKTWSAKEVIPQMSEVTITKKDAGIAWGGLYWQYFEDLDKITPASTPLKLNKKVFVVKRDNKGEVLNEVNSNTLLTTGDLLRIRIELSVDRAMEFLHMKDMRASGVEPVDVLSEYKWQDGLGYYQSTKDAATHFFFDSIQPGVYVFEYDLRVNNQGDFSNGITTIQSMYAPEFSSHSEGIRITIK